ncbi:hypothetical protein F4781DRAFT_22860 [Annulohypoxylon bovei var. microspora]|nr:hypothetical protein F4781DRAFT_22860 [Annulohypoxylon bovei var. microspora]
MSEPTEFTLEGDRTARCTSCLDYFPTTDIHELSCWHTYCTECMREMFKVSFQSGENFPPRCCNTPVNLTPRLAITLGQEIWITYITKRTEFEASSRVYCSKADCGLFIPDQYKLDNLAICRECYSYTCTGCKNPYHEGDCALYDGSAELKALAKKEGWAECYKCGSIIEKVDGCDRIECACGVSFCYKCSNSIGKCTCTEYRRPRARGRPLRDLGGFDRRERERRGTQRQLLKRLGQGVPPQSNIKGGEVEGEEEDEEEEATTSVPPVSSIPSAPSTMTKTSAPSSRRDNHLYHDCNHLYHDCNHHSKKLPVDGVDACPRCQRLTSKYILQCKGCGYRACWKCFKSIRHVKQH